MAIRSIDFIDKVLEAIGVGRAIGPVRSVTVTAPIPGVAVLHIERLIRPEEADRIAELVARACPPDVEAVDPEPAVVERPS